MSNDLPKQFMSLNRLPVLMHTIKAFHDSRPGITIYVALQSDWTFYWQQLCKELRFTIPHRITGAGETRFETVKISLQEIPSQGFIAIHDGARPLVSKDLIDRCFTEASSHGNAIPFIPVAESLREIYEFGNRPVNRENFVIIQTPQVFLAEIIKLAYEVDYLPAFTDDASVVESQGLAIQLIEGERNNIKITLPADLLIAEALTKHTSALPRRIQ